MKGCSKKTKTRKNYLGGSGDINLAYTGNDINFLPNPNLAYIGGNVDLGKTIPNQGPSAVGFNFLNLQGNQRGGCGTCGSSAMTGGKNHRKGCKCSLCKAKRVRQSGGNPGTPYPDGLTGAPWTASISGWPGVDGVQGGRNYLALNNYPTDISRQMVSTGANPPFSIGGGKYRNSKKTMRKKQRGGTLSNFFTQDLINLGRQIQFGVGGAYNAISGYSAPVNPMPWKGQIPNTPSLSTMRTSSL